MSEALTALRTFSFTLATEGGKGYVRNMNGTWTIPTRPGTKMSHADREHLGELGFARIEGDLTSTHPQQEFRHPRLPVVVQGAIEDVIDPTLSTDLTAWELGAGELATTLHEVVRGLGYRAFREGFLDEPDDFRRAIETSLPWRLQRLILDRDLGTIETPEAFDEVLGREQASLVLLNAPWSAPSTSTLQALCQALEDLPPEQAGLCRRTFVADLDDMMATVREATANAGLPGNGETLIVQDGFVVEFRPGPMPPAEFADLFERLRRDLDP